MSRKSCTPAAATFFLFLGALLWIGCGAKKSSEQEVTASLPELPQADAAKLKPVPRTQMLATSEIQLPAPPPPESESAIHPNCAANGSETDFSAEVKYSVTVCVFPNAPSAPIGTAPAPTHKLDSSRLSAEQQAITGQAPAPALKLLWCHQDDGPWQGFLSSERGCSGICASQNALTLNNTPNLVVFRWTGSPFDIPPGAPFSYASKPVALGPPVDEGRCHAQN